MDIVNTTAPMTPMACNLAINALVEHFPTCRSEILTTTAYGRPLQTLVVGNGPRKVLFTAAFHANEWITATLLLKFAQELAAAIESGGRIYDIPAKLISELDTIYMVPMVNPDGVALVTGELKEESIGYQAAKRMAADYPDIPFPQGWKANLLGVDLNLQYPALWLKARQIKFSQGYCKPGPRDYVGRAPLSQRESRALYGYTEFLRPELVLAFHTQGKEIYWNFQDIPVPGADVMAKEFARLSGYRVSQPAEMSSYAGFKDWFIERYRKPGFTIEAGTGVNPLPIVQFDSIYRDNLGILTTAALGLPET